MRCFVCLQEVFVILCLAAVCCFGQLILRGPSESAQVIGKETVFGCSVVDSQTNEVPAQHFFITWTFQPLDNLDAISTVMTSTHHGNRRYTSLSPDPDKYRNSDKPNLHVHKVTLADAGWYSCRSNITDGERGANLMIIEQPLCHNPKSEVYFEENISLECTVRYSGYRHPMVSWRFGSLRLNSTREFVENSTTLREKLVLEANEKVRGHIYHCQVSYPGLKAVECLALPPIQVFSRAQVLSLHVYPVIEGNEFPVGTNVMLHCVARGYPAPTFSWTFTPLGSDEAIEQSWTTSQLSITDLTTSQAGVYECQATNEIVMKVKASKPVAKENIEIYTDSRSVNLSISTHLNDNGSGKNAAFIIKSSSASAKQSSPQVAESGMQFSPYAIGAVISAGLAVLLIIVFVFMAMRMKKREKRMREKITRGHDDTLDDQEVELLDEGTQPNSDYLPTEYSRLKMSWEIPRKDVRLLEQVGQGAFVEVWKGRMRRSPGSTEVMRVIIKKLQGEATDKERHFFRAELEVLKMLPAHANVIRLVGSYTANEPWLMMMEQASEGTLQQFLQRHQPGHQQIMIGRGDKASVSMRKQTLTSQKLLALAAQVASGLDHLEKFKLIYYRLRSCKILVAKGGICKLSGFGFANEITERNTYEANSLPVRWTAPESLHGPQCNIKTDTWAYGIVIWEILHFGTTPYPTMGPHEVVESVQTGFRMPKPQHCSSELYELLLRCWHNIPEERPSYQEILEVLSHLVVNADIHIDFSALPDHLLSLDTGDNGTF